MAIVFEGKELKLVIEVDGITHSWGETVVRDRTKDEALKKAGFEIMRFNDEDVLRLKRSKEIQQCLRLNE